MKILFLFPNFAPIGGGGPPLGLAILIGIAKSKGHDIYLFDTSFMLNTHWYNPYSNFIKIKDEKYHVTERDLTISDINALFKQKVEEIQPDLICCSSVTPTHEIGRELIGGIDKKKDQIIVCGGLHPTICPEEVIHEKGVDIVCVGEGEIAFSELLDRLSSGGDYWHIKNLWVRRDNKVIRNSIGELIDAEKIPKSDFTLFEEKHFYKPFKGNKVRALRVELSRGCIYPCAYCVNKYLQSLFRGKGKYFRYKSVEQVLSELLFYMERYDLEMLFFKDEIFLFLPDRWLQEFADQYKSKIGLPFFCQSTAKDINTEKVALLKDMNCVAVAMGVEVGNEKYRKQILNKPVSNNEIRNAVLLLGKSGIRTTAYFMMGLPYETRDLIFETIQFQRELFELGCKPSQINCYHPFPGCKLYEIVKKEGFMRKDFDNRKTTVVSALDMPQLSSKEIDGLYRTFSAYTKVEEWMYPIVKLCENGNGKELEIISTINAHYAE